MSLPNGPIWTLAHVCLKFPALAAGVCAISLVSLYGLRDDTRPMVAITFDDGYQSVHQIALPEMTERGMVATNYITTGNIDVPGFVEESQIIDFVNAGWEIGAHTITHRDMTTVSDGELFQELIYPVTYLPSVSGDQEIFSYSSPLGAFDDRVLERIRDTYYNHVNAWSDQDGITLLETFDPFNIHRIDYVNTSVEEICETVTSLPENSLYSVIFHDISDNGGQYDVTPENFFAILDCIQEADVNVVRISDAAKVMEMRLAENTGE